MIKLVCNVSHSTAWRVNAGTLLCDEDDMLILMKWTMQYGVFLISLIIMINQAFKRYIKKILIQYTKSYKDKQGLVPSDQ